MRTTTTYSRPDRPTDRYIIIPVFHLPGKPAPRPVSSIKADKHHNLGNAPTTSDNHDSYDSHDSHDSHDMDVTRTA